jgi:hypothetical protein
VGIRDRLRRLEDRFGDRGPYPEEVSAAFARIAKNAKARLRGESIDKEHIARDNDIISQWRHAEEIDLQVEAERARHNLLNVR